jgi:hypothetical protein
MNRDAWNEAQFPDSPEARILASLTMSGRDPLELCFVVEGGLWSWDLKCGLFGHFLIEDSGHAQACKAYLRSKGLGFRTWDEVANWARARQWPALERLLSQVEKIKLSRGS